MKKRIMAGLSVSSAVIGVSLASLSAQAVTTGNTPVQVEFGGGTLPDADRDLNIVRPDPGATNNNFDLVFIPREYSLGKSSVSDDLTRPIPNKNDAGRSGYTEATGIGDLQGTKEGWHVTTQSDGMKLEGESLEGDITIGINGFYTSKYNENINQYTNQDIAVDMRARPESANPGLRSLPLVGDAILVANTTSGKEQGIWGLSMFDVALNITTSVYNIKAGAYTSNIIWNLVAGPPI